MKQKWSGVKFFIMQKILKNMYSSENKMLKNYLINMWNFSNKI